MMKTQNFISMVESKPEIVIIEPVNKPTRRWDSGTIKLTFEKDYLIFEENGKVSYFKGESEIVEAGRHYQQLTLPKQKFSFDLYFLNSNDTKIEINQLIEDNTFFHFFRLTVSGCDGGFALNYKPKERQKALDLIAKIKKWVKE